MEGKAFRNVHKVRKPIVGKILDVCGVFGVCDVCMSIYLSIYIYIYIYNKMFENTNNKI